MRRERPKRAMVAHKINSSMIDTVVTRSVPKNTRPIQKGPIASLLQLAFPQVHGGIAVVPKGHTMR